MLRREAIEHVGPFDDERFFLYAEETDWAYRAHRLGWRHAVVDAAVAQHVGAGTSTDPVRRDTHFHAAQERYARKHHGGLGWQATRVAGVAGAAARAVALRGPSRESARRRLAHYLRGPLAVERSVAPAARPAEEARR